MTLKNYISYGALAVAVNLPIASFAKDQVAKKLTDIDYIRAYGYTLGKQTLEGSASMLDLSPQETEALRQGVTLGIQGQEIDFDYKANGEAMLAALEKRSDKVQEKQQAIIEQEIQMNKKAAQEEFKKLDANKKISKTASGLYYEIIKPGSTKKPTSDATVKIHYEGRLLDGKVFDSSKKREMPATFGVGQVIPGFQEGLQLVGEGGTIRLHIPSELAYGDNSLPGIPAGSMLIFEVDLLEILPKS